MRRGGAAGPPAAAGWAVKLVAPPGPALVRAALVFSAFGAVYLALTAAMGEGESAALVARVRRRAGRR